ncbi:MAG TPA: preprotein translocase subunit SecE [Thermomicrobiales bacterium]|nr:preprotein translocase subunit SecE [Thermomicrobiales bacterium]
MQEATQAAIASQAQQEEQRQEELSRAEARRRAKAESAKARTGGRGIISSERTEGIRKYVRETNAEIKKVVWPDRETTRNLTLLVIALSAVLGMLLGGIDWVLFEIFEAF